MSEESERQRLNHYLNGAREDAIGDAGKDWQKKGRLLQVVAEALRTRGPELAERLGRDSQTADELREALLKASLRMQTTSTKLADAGDALVVVGDNLEKARAHRKAMKSLVEPPTFVEPTYAGGQPTPEEILDAANKRAASNKEHGDYRSASNGQEADAAEITSKLDEAFLSAIPPMMAIHGGPDPTKKKRNGDHFVLVQFSGETEQERKRRRRRERAAEEERRELQRLKQAEYERREQAERDRAEAERERQERLERERAEREQRERDRLEHERQERLERERQEQERRDRERYGYTPTPVATTNVQGGTDGGTTYQVAESGAPTSTQSSAPASATASSGSMGGSTLGVGAGVVGAGGAVIRAGGAISGGVIAAPGGSVGAGTSSAAIGAGGRSGVPGSLGGATGTAGAPMRATGAIPGQAGAPGKGSGKGSGKGRGLFRRGSGGSTTGGRGKQKNDAQANQRDALVYDQDWLGDDSAGPGVLD